jgi:RNA methyltransferase, TrmH family
MTDHVTSIKHPEYRDAIALTRQAGRAASGRYLAEDIHLVRQALKSDARVFGVFATAEHVAELGPLCESRGVTLHVCGAGLMTKLIGTAYETAASAVAIVAQRLASPESLASPGALILAGERIVDPRNVGVLVRTADAIGASGLLLCADSAEAHSRQAVRSTTGSILRLPLAIVRDLPAALLDLKSRGAKIVSSSGSAASDASGVDLRGRPLVVVVGNEQDGIGEGVAKASDAIVRLPMASGTGADSYNVTVAAGMLLYECVRQQDSV